MEPDEITTMGESVRLLGMATGCLIGIALWAVILFAIWAATRWL